MANYYGAARSNYFRVKDIQAFKCWAEGLDLKVIHGTDQGNTTFALLPPHWSDDGCFPSYKPDTNEHIDLAAELSLHLDTDSVAIIIEIGAEKLRYLHGHALAINASGETVTVQLADIYNIAATKLKGEITHPEY